MELLCLVLGVICLGYYALMAAVGMDFSFIWLAGGIVLFGGGLWMKFAKVRGLHIPGMVKAAGIVLAGVGLLIFFVLEGLIISKMGLREKKA